MAEEPKCDEVLVDLGFVPAQMFINPDNGDYVAIDKEGNRHTGNCRDRKKLLERKKELRKQADLQADVIIQDIEKNGYRPGCCI